MCVCVVEGVMGVYLWRGSVRRGIYGVVCGG